MDEVLKQIAAAALRSLADAGLSRGADAGVSIADQMGGRLAVTAAGIVSRDADAAGVASVGLADGLLVDGPVPTPELALHLALARAGFNAAIHVLAPCAATVGLAYDELPVVLAEQAARVGWATPVIGYRAAGSELLAHEVAAAMQGRRSVIVRHHALVVGGPDIASALAAAIAVEDAARCYLAARSLGPVQRMAEADVAALRRAAGLEA